ncbi:hypothetical protein H0H92_004949 [Tricholoma furcatifolium]|nr:hypothetical protein H0H92_004949 [Tricholoma furcatifolium]
MLDSPPSRPLKRSASVASLPTPPRTHHKKKHVSDDDSSASEAETTHKHKKQRTSSSNDDEEAFWLNKSDGDVASNRLPSGLVYRRRLAGAPSVSSVGSAPVSPPPSNRKPIAVAAPVTPEPIIRRSVRNTRPVRDSPNNPFLVSPDAASIVADSASPSPSLSPHTPKHHERSTVTYVFRGVKGTFPNPLYNHELDRPLSPSAHSKLPLTHPDYSPEPHCPPKVLFPARRSRAVKGLEEELRAKKRRSRSPSVGASDEDSEDDDEKDLRRSIKPTKLDFTATRVQAQAGL